MRTEIAIISALTLVLSVPLAFGEIVETKGQNYDLWFLQSHQMQVVLKELKLMQK